MKRRSKQQRLVDARLQRAVCGFMIPMLAIPNLYRAMELAVEQGKTDADLKALVKAFPGVEVA